MSKRNLQEWWQELDNDLISNEPSPHPTTGSPPRKPSPAKDIHQDKELVVLLQQEDGQESFNFTYQASRHERVWLLDSLGDFYEHRWIDDVLRMVKGGKEASVYLCAGNQTTQEPLLAAKVYRPRMFRNLRNDAMYREGRATLDADGHEIRDGRMKRAIRHRTDYGLGLLHTSWLEHEYTTLITLHSAGADVPKPFICDHNAILMGYIGDEALAAPPLSAVHLNRKEAKRLFEQVVHNIDLMLANNLVHSDLSAFNILYWEGDITLIDFPQAIAPEQNLNAFRIFERDVRRVCEYFARQEVKTDPHQLAEAMWTAHHHRLVPEVHPALLDDENEQDLAYWNSLQDDPAWKPR